MPKNNSQTTPKVAPKKPNKKNQQKKSAAKQNPTKKKQQKAAVPKRSKEISLFAMPSNKSGRAGRADHLNVEHEADYGSTVALIPANNVVLNTALFSNSPDHQVFVHAEASLYDAWHRLPPDYTLAGVNGTFSPANLRNYLVWAFIDKMRSMGMVTNLPGSASMDVYSCIPTFPETFAIPVGFAHFIKAHLPYRHPSGATYSWLWQLPDPTFFSTAAAGHLANVANVANTSGFALIFPGLTQQTPTTFTEYVNTVDAGTSFTWAGLYQNARTISQWYNGAVSCTTMDKIGEYANDASAYCSYNQLIRTIQCPVAEFSGELGYLYRYPRNTTPVGYFHSKPIPSVQYDFTNLGSVNLTVVLPALSYHFILNQCDWHPHLHKSMETGPYPGLTSLIPTFTTVSCLGYANAVESAMMNLVNGQNQNTVVAAFIVLWSALVARLSHYLMFSSAFGNVVRGRWAFDPTYRTIPIPTACEEWLSGVGPVVKDGRLLMPTFSVPDGGQSGVASRSWLNYITGMTGSLSTVHQVFSTNMTMSTTSPFGINVAFTNGVADTPVNSTPFFKDQYDTLTVVSDFVAPSMPEYGLSDFLASTVYDVVARQNARQVVVSGQLTASFLYTNVVRAVGADFILSGQDILRVASHLYTLIASTAVYSYPYMVRMGNMSSPGQSAYDYISTAGFDVVNNTIANAQADDKPGVGYGGFSFIPKKDESIGRNALRQVMASYWNEDSAQSVALTDTSLVSSAKRIAYSISRSLVQDYLPTATTVAKNVMRGLVSPGGAKGKILTAVLGLGRDMLAPDIHTERQKALPRLEGKRGPVIELLDD